MTIPPGRPAPARRAAALSVVVLVVSSLIAAVLLAPPARAQALSPVDDAAIRAEIGRLLASEPALPLPVRQRRDGLAAYYDAGGPLLWIGTGRAPQLVNWLAAADEDGLNAADYPSAQLGRLAEAMAATDTAGQAIIELHFSAAFLQYASDLRVGRVLPTKVDPDFFIQKKAIDPVAALRGLAASRDIDTFFNAWQPQSPEYAGLRVALADYRALAAAGGWPGVPMGETLKPGMTDPRVPALRARLAVTDGAEPAAAGAGEVYDDGLVAVVKSFQARHGLDPDGAVGRATIVALNVPVEARIEEIVVAMERWRWLPDDLGRDHVMVNIAGFELSHIRDGALVQKMAVVVGKPYSRTPVFSDAIRYAEFNPYWNVPAGIAVKEELPKLKANPAARAAAGFEAVQGNTVYPLTSIDWRRYGPGNFPFQIRQRPGPDNALGRVKFMFPNKFDVYLHDTPARSLFSRTDRAFSHGCIRLSRPIDFAVDILGGTPGWDRARIDRVVASQQRTVVNLATPLPIHITYFTAWVDQGVPQFRADIYEQDAKLIAALKGQAMSW